MRGYEEGCGWGKEQSMQYEGPAASWQQQGNIGNWDTWGGQWDQFSSDDANGSEEFESIMNWDDSGAQEALRMAKERYEASLKGLVYTGAQLSPDLYIQDVNWDVCEAYDLPDSADSFAAREGKRWNRRRGPRGGKSQGVIRGGLVRQEHIESPGWKEISNEVFLPSPTGWAEAQANPTPTGWGEIQSNPAPSSWDYLMTDGDRPALGRDGQVNGPTGQTQPVFSGWQEGQPNSVQTSWQEERNVAFGWHRSPHQTQHTNNGWGDSPNLSGQQTNPSAWGFRDNFHQTSGGTQRGSSSGIHQSNPSAAGHWNSRMGDRRPGGWRPQGQTSGRNTQPQSRDGNIPQSRAGNFQRVYGGPPSRNSRWERPRQQWRPNGPVYRGTTPGFP